MVDDFAHMTATSTLQNYGLIVKISLTSGSWTTHTPFSSIRFRELFVNAVKKSFHCSSFHDSS
jgi:hypothetical protein